MKIHIYAPIYFFLEYKAHENTNSDLQSILKKQNNILTCYLFNCAL